MAPKRILAPVDFSEFSDRALRYALSFAQRFNAELVLVHVVEAFPIDFLMGIKSVKQANEWQLQQARTHLRKLCLELTADRRISAESVVKFGKPFNEIVEVAKDRGIDLIIIGTHGYTGLKHIQLGSTAEMVVRYAPCPVVVLPNRGSNEGAVKEK
jgi:universal stress protein A